MISAFYAFGDRFSAYPKIQSGQVIAELFLFDWRPYNHFLEDELLFPKNEKKKKNEKKRQTGKKITEGGKDHTLVKGNLGFGIAKSEAKQNRNKSNKNKGEG